MSTHSANDSVQHHRSTNSFAKRLCQVGAVLLLALGLGLAGPMKASAQAPHQASPEAEETEAVSPWRANFDEHVARKLRQVPSMRTSLIQVTMNAAAIHERLNLDRTVGALLHVVEHDSHRERRLMAIQALHRILPGHVGETRYREAMDQLYALMQDEPSAQVRNVAAATLSRYFKSG